MALIAKIFSADLGDENAKGNLLPQDLAAILGFLNPHDAGILNIPEKDCSQFGSINITGQTAIVTFHAGYIVIHGRLVYIEEGTEVAFNLPTSGSVNGVLGIKINLAESGANEVTWFQKTSGVVTEDLIKKETDGIYEFVLYNYTATDLSFTLGAKTTQVIDRLPKVLNDVVLNAITQATTQPLNDKSRNVATTEFVKNSCGEMIIRGYVTFRAYDRGNNNKYGTFTYDFEGQGLFAISSSTPAIPSQIIWKGNIMAYGLRNGSVSPALGGNQDVGFVGTITIIDFKITYANNTFADISQVTKDSIGDLGILYNYEIGEQQNVGRIVAVGGTASAGAYYPIDDGKRVHLEASHLMRIDDMAIGFKINA